MKSLRSNSTLALDILLQMQTLGVTDLVLGSGARNSPLLKALDDFLNFKKYFIFEERSAAFFALGLSQSTHRPVAVITTSGTAAAEILPATIEAYYTGTPLILITADRPKNFRGTGAPQSIEQVGLFLNYVEKVLDIDETTPLQDLFSEWSQQKSIHLNVCFKEPLLDAAESPPKLPITLNSCRPSDQGIDLSQERKYLTDFLQENSPVILLSTLKKTEQEVVLNFLKPLDLPLYIETSSGLRNHTDLCDKTIYSGEGFVRNLMQREHRGLLRIGGIPTTKIWRDLEKPHDETPILSISHLPFLGTTRSHPLMSFNVLKTFGESAPTATPQHSTLAKPSEWKSHDLHRYKQIERIIKTHPNSEPSFIYHLSCKIKNQNLYLGNSLPIREWDLFASQDHCVENIFCNRGANGIDGQLSTFLGIASSNPEIKNWGLFGDLTTMYDLSAPYILTQKNVENLCFVILNNKGGKIFQRMFQREDMLNRHSFEFKSWAEMWNLSYAKATKAVDLLNPSECQVLELQPSEEETYFFWKEYEKI